MSLFDRFSLAQRSLISSVAGFLFYGVWAFLVNITHGPQAAIKAACVQGAYSFLVTLGMTLMLEAMYRSLLKLTGFYWFSSFVTVIICCALVFTGSWTLTVAAGTPEVFETVILGYFIGAMYSSSYVFGLLKKSQS
ncbi:MAG: hypothetical protein JKX81_16155 [Arenicella sp.]|nr:hypothetical protein [Arenicella sp.]